MWLLRTSLARMYRTRVARRVQASVADQAERFIVALSAVEGGTILSRQDVGSALPPDLLLVVD